MQYREDSLVNYINQLPEERKEPVNKLREVIKANLPKGFEEGINYGMIGYYVPHSLYPAGYHCDPKLPLPFMNIASQKNSINLYHMGIYALPELHDWFLSEYPNYAKRKLDMGKSCIRFKHLEDIPYKLIAELCQKLTSEAWISIYEGTIKK